MLWRVKSDFFVSDLLGKRSSCSSREFHSTSGLRAVGIVSGDIVKCAVSRPDYRMCLTDYPVMFDVLSDLFIFLALLCLEKSPG